MRNIKMFATNNSTAQWAVTVDGLFQLFTSKSEAAKLYDLIPSGIDSSPFGSCQIIPPYHVCEFINGWLPDGGCDDVALKPQSDIENYIRKNLAKKFNPEITTPVQHYRIRKELECLFN